MGRCRPCCSGRWGHCGREGHGQHQGTAMELEPALPVSAPRWGLPRTEPGGPRGHYHSLDTQQEILERGVGTVSMNPPHSTTTPRHTHNAPHPLSDSPRPPPLASRTIHPPLSAGPAANQLVPTPGRAEQTGTHGPQPPQNTPHLISDFLRKGQTQPGPTLVPAQGLGLIAASRLYQQRLKAPNPQIGSNSSSTT